MASDIIVIERALLQAQVFRDLSGSGKTVLFDFFLKRQFQKVKMPVSKKKEWVNKNNGQLEYSYAEAEAKGFPRTTFMRTLDELILKGFLDVTHSGSGGQKGDKSTYATSDRWKHFGTEKFIEKIRPRDIRGGRGFKRGNLEWMKTRKAQSANIGAKSGNPRGTSIAKSGNPSFKNEKMDCQKWQLKKRAKMAENRTNIGKNLNLPT